MTEQQVKVGDWVISHSNIIGDKRAGRVVRITRTRAYLENWVAPPAFPVPLSEIIYVGKSLDDVRDRCRRANAAIDAGHSVAFAILSGRE